MNRLTYWPHFLYASTSLTYLGQVHIWRSWVKLQGHGNKKTLIFSLFSLYFSIVWHIMTYVHYLYIWQVKLSILKVIGQGQTWRSRSNKQKFVLWHYITLYTKCFIIIHIAGWNEYSQGQRSRSNLKVKVKWVKSCILTLYHHIANIF